MSEKTIYLSEVEYEHSLENPKYDEEHYRLCEAAEKEELRRVQEIEYSLKNSQCDQELHNLCVAIENEDNRRQQNLDSSIILIKKEIKRELNLDDGDFKDGNNNKKIRGGSQWDNSLYNAKYNEQLCRLLDIKVELINKCET